MLDIDLQKLLPHNLLAVLGEEFVEAVLDDVAAMARAKWIRLAQTQLGSSKRDYIQGIQPVEQRPGERIITLVGDLPNMVEKGISGFDLRETLLGEGKGRQTEDGHRYRPIPFRHGTPGSKGQAGTPMGSRLGPQGSQSLAFASSGLMSRSAAEEMGKAIHRQAKRLKSGQSLPGRTTITLRGPGKRPKVTGPTITVPKLAPHHSTDIFAGMRRTQKKYKSSTQSQYTTFRTISTKNQQGWIHPGIRGRNLHQQVEAHVGDYLGQVVGKALKRALAPLGGGE